MKACPESLPDDPLLLKALIRSLFQKNALQEERLRILLHKQFGASSEKTSPDQQTLFNQAEQDQQPEQLEPEPEENAAVAEHSRQKKGRKPLPKTCQESEKSTTSMTMKKNCGGCGGKLHRIGEKVTEQHRHSRAISLHCHQ